MMLLDNKEYKQMKGKTGYASGCQEEKKEVLIAQFQELTLKDSGRFADYMRRPNYKFIELLNMIGPSIQKKDT